MEEFLTRIIAFTEQTTVDFITVLNSVAIVVRLSPTYVDPRSMIDLDPRKCQVSCVSGGHIFV